MDLLFIIIGIPILLTIMNLYYLIKPYVKWDKKKHRLNESDESQTDIFLQVMQEDTNLKRNQRKKTKLSKGACRYHPWNLCFAWTKTRRTRKCVD